MKKIRFKSKYLLIETSKDIECGEHWLTIEFGPIVQKWEPMEPDVDLGIEDAGQGHKFLVIIRISGFIKIHYAKRVKTLS